MIQLGKSFITYLQSIFTIILYTAYKNSKHYRQSNKEHLIFKKALSVIPNL